MKGLPYLASDLSFCIELLLGKHTCHMRHELGLSQKGRNGGIITFSIDSYYRDLSCSKSITKCFVMYLVNDM